MKEFSFRKDFCRHVTGYCDMCWRQGLERQQGLFRPP